MALNKNSTNTPNQNQNPNPKKRKRSLLLNWQLWLSACVGLILVMVGLAFAFGPAAIVATVAAILGGAGLLSKPLIDFGGKILEEIKESRDKAGRAAGVAVILADRVDTNSERTDLLDTRFEILSDMAYKLTENLQQEHDKSEVKITKLEDLVESLIKQNQEQQQQINRLKDNHQREIAELKEQIYLMGVEKSSDKEQIILLKSQVKQLQDRVKELEDREGKLTAENEALKEELKIGLRRRVTDPLPGLSGEAEERFNRREGENSK